MIQATPATNKTKKDTRKTCTVCKKRFNPSRRTIMTCSEECKIQRRNGGKKTTAQKKRQPKQFPLSNPFVQLLIRHAKQAGTVQIFQYVTVAELLELRDMQKVMFAGNASHRATFGNFHFSHIYPTHGQRHVGKFVPKNLVVANGELNRRRGTSYFGGGDFISPAHSSNRWDIRQGMTPHDIAMMILDCIGRDVWSEFDKVAKLAPNARQDYIDALLPLLNRCNPDHAEWLKVFDNPRTSTKDLRLLYEAVTGKTVFVVGSREYLTAMEVMISEAKRMTTHRPELEPVLVALEQIEQTSRYVTCNSFELGEYEPHFFDWLHGLRVDCDELQSVLNAALGSLTDGVSFDRKVIVRPIDLFSVEQLAEYHEMAATSFLRGPDLSAEDGHWLDSIPSHQWL